MTMHHAQDALEVYADYKGFKIGEEVWVYDGRYRGWEQSGDLGDNSCFYSRGYIQRITLEKHFMGGQDVIFTVNRRGTTLIARVFETSIDKMGRTDKDQSRMGESPYLAACRYLPELMHKVEEDKVHPEVLGRVIRFIVNYAGLR